MAGDIRHYGLLKTIGTTGKQIKKIVRIQSLLLSIIGIPTGLLLGYGTGVLLAPVIIKTVSNNNSVYYSSASANPVIFIGAALFSVITVLISCRKPSKMAGKVSPIEALRYTESDSLSKKRKVKKVSKKGISIFSMAFANMGRNRKKTFVTVLSMSLSIVLFTLTVILSNGFSMEKYLSNMISTDFIEEDYIRNGRLSRYYSAEDIEHYISSMPREGNQILNEIDIYGMDEFCLDELKVWDGDISRLKTEENVIAAVYFEDDYGNINDWTNWAKVGDTVKIRYSEETEYYDTQTGEIYEVDNLDRDRKSVV